MKALILAGGFGTRLAHIISDVPKPMAPIAGVPFLEYLISHLRNSGVDSVIMLTGYLSSVISDHFGDGTRFGIPIDYQVEKEPLGTGGAVALALRERFPEGESVLVVNGDTFFDFDLQCFLEFQGKRSAPLVVGLKLMESADRYGSVLLQGSRISAFKEKAPGQGEGYINGGVYILDSRILSYCPLSQGFSFEGRVIPAALKAGAIEGIPFGGRFIDIGIPEDYGSAQELLPQWARAVKRKAAFIDRDGTIVIDSGYVHEVKDLELKKGAILLLTGLSAAGFEIFIVSNQAGIAKGLYAEDDAKTFNAALVAKLRQLGIHIVASSFCPFHEEGIVEAYKRPSLRRKPNPGMILDLADQYNIDLSQSVMIGDNSSDRIDLDYLSSYVLGEDGSYSDILEEIKHAT